MREHVIYDTMAEALSAGWVRHRFATDRDRSRPDFHVSHYLDGYVKNVKPDPSADRFPQPRLPAIPGGSVYLRNEKNMIGDLGCIVDMVHRGQVEGWAKRHGLTLESDTLLTTAEAAEKLRVSVRSVQSYVDRGQLPAVKHGRDLFIPQGSLDRFLRLPRGRRWPEKEPAP